MVPPRCAQTGISALAISALACALGLLGPVPALAEQSEQLPDVTRDGSHEQFLKLLDSSRAATYRKIVALYDQHLEANPSAVQTAVERCQFITSVALADEEYTGEPIAEPVDCAVRLAERFPGSAAVLVLQMDQLWGKDAVAFGLETLQREDVAWTAPQRAAFLGDLAWAYHAIDKIPQAAAWAIEARRFGNPDVTLILANFYRDAGRRTEAIAELVQASDVHLYAYQKVALLIELEAFDEALALIAELANRGIEIAALQHAAALEGAGRTQEARRKYDEVAGQQWNRSHSLERLFYIDLKSGDADQAIAAYEAMRAEGFAADPFLRHRLALAAAFPSAAWRSHDLLGALALLALYLCCAMLPLALIVPVHYVGLIRAPRAAPTTGAGSRWSLKHLWIISASVLCAELTAAYVLDYGWLHALFVDTHEAAPDYGRLARLGIVCIVGGFASVAVWLRRSDYAVLVRCSWSRRQILGAAIGGTAVVYAVNALTRVLLRASGVELDAAVVTAVVPTTLDVLRAILGSCGPWVLVSIVVIAAPFYEEVWFRSVFLGSAQRHLSSGWSNAVQAGVFALVHGEPERLPALFVMGLLAGVFALRAGGIAPAIALHMVLNLGASAAIIAQRSVDPGGRAGPRPAAALKLRSETELARADAALLSLDCDHGFVNACSELSRRSATRGRLLHAQTGCDRGDLAACDELAVLYERGEGVRMDVERAAELHRRACDGGHALGCTRLGACYADGRGVPRDPASAARYFGMACDAGNPAGCNQLGLSYGERTGVPGRPDLAADLFRRACDGGDAAGCTNLADAYERGAGVQQDRAAALQLRRKACDSGSALSCSNLGVHHENGDGVKKNFEEAARLYRKACANGFSGGCRNLGLLYTRSGGLPPDPVFAADLFHRACKAGDASGCYELAVSFHTGEGVARDREKAATLYKQACDAGSGSGCFELSRLHAKGTAVRKDPALARSLRARACDLGVAKACDREKP